MHKNIMVFGILESMPSACPGSVMPVTGLSVQVVPTRKNRLARLETALTGNAVLNFLREFSQTRSGNSRAIVAAPNVR